MCSLDIVWVYRQSRLIITEAPRYRPPGASVLLDASLISTILSDGYCQSYRNASAG